jgi:hypothetical protein
MPRQGDAGKERESVSLIQVRLPTLIEFPMGLENVDEKRFSVEEAVAAAGTDFGKAPPPLLQPVVSSVTAGNSWANVLRRYLIGESIRICIAVGGDAGVYWYPPGSDISDDVVRRQLEDFAFDDEQGRIVPRSEFLGSPKSVAEGDVEINTGKSGQAHRVFEIGETVRKVVMQAKSIDAVRGNPSVDAAYSLREISAMAVRERLEGQFWDR